MIVPQPIKLHPHFCGISEAVAEVPAKAGVYVLHPVNGSPHLSSSANLRARVRRLLIPRHIADGERITEIRNHLVAVECWPTTSRLESALLTFQLAREFFPDAYLKRLRLRHPFFIGLTTDPFPRLQITNRVSRSRSSLLGPFASREAAERYTEAVLNLFQIRRCIERLTPDPSHPGCIYGEMNQCLRPCQHAVTAERYASETDRVAEFLATNGRAALTRAVMERDRASASLDFEAAAQLHKRTEKLSDAISARDAVISNVFEFGGLALTRGAHPHEVRLWPMFNGYWQDPLSLNFSGLDFQSKSLDQQIREVLGAHLSTPKEDGDRAEQLALFARWYYSSWRDGHWFPFRNLNDINYRKLVREISKAKQNFD